MRLTNFYIVVTEAFRVLSILRNPKANLIKKRHAMRTTFGDYRKKMEEEEKQMGKSKEALTVYVYILRLFGSQMHVGT